MSMRTALAVALLCLSRAALTQGGAEAHPPAAAGIEYGAYAVGFRSVPEVDRSRMVHARTAFDGTPIDGDPAMPMRIAVWYPAEAPTANAVHMTRGDYERMGRGPTRERDAILADWTRMLGFAGLAPARADLEQALDLPRRAVLDAPPMAGRHPLVIGGMEGPAGCAPLAEYLASHGFVVVTAPSLPRTGTQQASAPLLALETQARNLEYLLAFAHGLPFADESRLGVIGVNFDGMAALVFEMRNMRADAIVSLDGWEGKKGGAATLREAPHYDPVRLRVPYLVVEQDETGVPPSLAHDKSLWSELKYSSRQWYVVRGLGHLFLTTGQIEAPGLPPGVTDAYAFLYRTVREFLEAHVKKDPPAAEAPASALVKDHAAAAALAPAPTGEEFEQLVMAGPMERAVEIFRRAKAANPDLVLADEATLNLYAFRFGQQKKAREVLALRELAAEAFAASARAAYNLALARLDAGDLQGARAALGRALPLIDADSSLTPDDKARLRADIRQRLGG